MTPPPNGRGTPISEMRTKKNTPPNPPQIGGEPVYSCATEVLSGAITSHSAEGPSTMFFRREMNPGAVDCTQLDAAADALPMAAAAPEAEPPRGGAPPAGAAAAATTGAGMGAGAAGMGL